MMLIESDHRYASILIDPPHAPLKPTSPLPTIDAAVAFALSCLVWFGIVRLAPESGRWRGFLNIFARPRPRRRRVKSAIAAKAGSTVSG
jgi:F0F1-type ATP synthase membrane subunit a